MERNLSAPRYRPCRNLDPDSVGVKMRLARYALGMTQQQLAAHFGVTREAIYRIENGRRGERSTKRRVRFQREKMRIWAELNKPAGSEDVEALFA
jgi:DNA-binding XRE family transcriptional regulator